MDADFPTIGVLVIGLSFCVTILLCVCHWCTYYRGDEETRERMRLRAQGAVPVYLMNQNRRESTHLLDAQNRDPPPAYNNMTVENEIQRPQTNHK